MKKRPDNLVYVCRDCGGSGTDPSSSLGEAIITCGLCGGHGYYDDRERREWEGQYKSGRRKVLDPDDSV